jgi:hypothetical protein
MQANTAVTSSIRSQERVVKSRNADFTVGTASEKSEDFLSCKQVSVLHTAPLQLRGQEFRLLLGIHRHEARVGA